MIQVAVSQLQGVEKIEGDTGARTITLSYQPELTILSDVRRAMADAGYPTSN